MNAKAEFENPKICFDRIVPFSLGPRGAAVQRAMLDTVMQHLNVQHPREVLKDLDPSKLIHPMRLALLVMKKWEIGSTLRCRFLDGTPTQQERAVEKARIWQDYANIKIDFVKTTDEQVRISFTPGQGSWSAIGSDALNSSYFPKYQPTMNFGWLTDDTDDVEYRRVVVHEFGHALGCIHEHQQPDENLQWDPGAVYKYFSGPPNYWSKEEIDENVLQKYSKDGVSFTIFDIKSIMLYQFPDYLFLDKKGTPNNTELSVLDKQLISQMYPK